MCHFLKIIQNLVYVNSFEALYLNYKREVNYFLNMSLPTFLTKRIILMFETILPSAFCKLLNAEFNILLQYLCSLHIL